MDEVKEFPNHRASMDATEFVGECYTDISRYVARTRVYCSIVDGLKCSYRRTIYASRPYTSRVKSATLVGDGLKYHPHGDGNIYGALVSMTCEFGRFPLYNGKGNFGGLGEGAAAMRYTEAVLSELSRLMFMELIDYAEFIDGEAGNPEPRNLPALLPYCLLVGSGGIPIGLPGAKIPQVDAMQLIDYYVASLKGETPIPPVPDYGNCIIDQDLESARDVIRKGSGKLWFRAIITQEDDYRFVITDTTPGKSIDNVLKKLQWYIDNDIVDYTDESSSQCRYVFEIIDPSKCSAEQLKNDIDRALKSTLSVKYIFSDDEGNANYCGLDYMVRQSIKYLTECSVRKFTDSVGKLTSRLDVLLAIEDFKNTDMVAQMHIKTKEEVVDYIVSELGYSKDTASKVLAKPMSYLTRSHLDEIEGLKSELESNKKFRDHPEEYLLGLYDRLRELARPVYDARSHSRVGQVVGDILEQASDSYATLSEDRRTVIISESETDASIKMKSSLIAVKANSEVTKMRVSASPGMTVELDDEVVSLCEDGKKYIVVMSWYDKSYTVKKLSDLPKSKVVAKMVGGDLVTRAFTTNAEFIEFTLDNGKTKIINLEDSVKSRVSRPLYLGDHPTVSYAEYDHNPYDED